MGAYIEDGIEVSRPIQPKHDGQLQQETSSTFQNMPDNIRNKVTIFIFICLFIHCYLKLTLNINIYNINNLLIYNVYIEHKYAMHRSQKKTKKTNHVGTILVDL